MNFKKTLAIGLTAAALYATPAHAEPGWRESIFQPVAQTTSGVVQSIKNLFSGQPKAELTKRSVKAKDDKNCDCHRGNRNAGVSKREAHNPTLDYIPGKASVTGGFCREGDALKIVMPQLTDAQQNAGYKLRLEMEGKPKFSWFEDGLSIDGYEMRSGRLTNNDLKYVRHNVQDVVKNGTVQTEYTLIMPKENFSLVLRDKHGHKKAETPFGMTVKAKGECPQGVVINQTLINAPNATLGTDGTTSTSTQSSTTSSTTSTTNETTSTTSGDYNLLGREGSWSGTLGVRSLTNTLESKYSVTDRNGTRLVPIEETYSGNALLASLDYTSPNKSLSLRLADSFGTDGSDNRYHNVAEKRVDAQSLTADLELLGGKGNFKLGGFLLGEGKQVTFSQGAMDVNDVTLRNRNLVAIPGLEALWGDLNGQYLKVRGGVGIQHMEFHRPDNSPSDVNRGSGVTDTILMGEIGVRKNFTDGVAVFGNYRHIQLLDGKSTTELDRAVESQSNNYRAGLDFRIFGNDRLHLLLGAGGNLDDSEFPGGIPFNNSGTVYDALLKFGK